MSGTVTSIADCLLTVWGTAEYVGMSDSGCLKSDSWGDISQYGMEQDGEFLPVGNSTHIAVYRLKLSTLVGVYFSSLTPTGNV